jgi:hypothetical protein
VGGAQQLEAVDLGAGVGLLVGQYDARRELFEAQATDEAAPRAPGAVGPGEALLDHVERRLVVAAQHAGGAPVGQHGGSRRVAAGRHAGRRLGQLDVNGVVRAAPPQGRRGGRRDHVVGRADDVGERDTVGVVAQAAKRPDVSHGRSPLAGDAGSRT